MTKDRWSDAQIEDVMKRCERGESLAAIAATIGRTRGAVSGMINRHRKRMKKPVPTADEKKAAPAAPSIRKRVEVPTARKICCEFPGPNKCRWPFGHPGDKGFRFCGAPTSSGQPYCEAHKARAYVKRSSDTVEKDA